MPTPISFDYAVEYLVSYLKQHHSVEPDNPNSNLANFGFEIWVPNIARTFHSQHPELVEGERDARAADIWHGPIFLDAAWQLSRQGILRPSAYWPQSGSHGGSGQGFSVTAGGRKWLQKSDEHTFIFTHPGAYAKYLDRYKTRFGEGYSQRAEQALLCFSSAAYLATCAMAGATAESIIFAAAIEKVGEEEAIRLYEGRSGTKAITNKVTEHLGDRLKPQFDQLTDIIKHWRNPSSHGQFVEIGDIDAMTALTTLVRFAQFANSHWDELSTVSPI